jgi:hypothetical protein
MLLCKISGAKRGNIGEPYNEVSLKMQLGCLYNQTD